MTAKRYADELPTEERIGSGDAQYDYIATFIATLLDTAFTIPGTRMKVGLDPLLGLIPGFGDTLANLLGTSLLFIAAQVHVPRIVLVRMSVNIFLNAGIGSIPGVGDLFSFWFKSNIRNLALLRRHATRSGKSSTTGDWIFVISLVLGILILFVLLIVGTVWLLRVVWELVRS
jgi:hypothetical protein